MLPTPYPTHPAPRVPQHFSGELVSKTTGNCLGLHRLEVRLVDEDGGAHVIYMACGRGDLAAEYAQGQYDRLTVGAWYHGSATMVCPGPHQTQWAGDVTLAPCQRRHRFSHTAGAAA